MQTSRGRVELRPAGRRRLPGLRGEIRFVAGAVSASRLPPTTLPEVAFAGRSNVGKSSLLNRLVGRRGLARVSKTPGRTQQINFFSVGGQLMLVDLPGYGFARVPLAVRDAWRRLVEHYLRSREQLRGVVVIVDARRGLQAEDAMLLDLLAVHHIAARLVATKVDKIRRSQRARQLSALAGERTAGPAIAFSATSGEGIGEVWEAVTAMGGGD